MLANAQLWSLTNPVLYTATASIPGNNFSSNCANFGFRWFTPDSIGTNALLRLNGNRIVLRSAISWGYWAPNGLFPDDNLAQQEVTDAKTLGLNCLNFHRYIGHPNVLDQQDQLGLLRYEEPGAGFNTYNPNENADPGNSVPPTDTSGAGGVPNTFQEQYETDKILAMVRRDRSHPSLVVYCIQNENNPALTNSHIWYLFRQILAIDPSRTVVLHSGVPAYNEIAMLPYATNFLYDNGTGYSGWSDQHTVGGPGNYQDSLYINPTNFSHYTTNTHEIVDWGEMLGVGMPDDHEKIVEYISDQQFHRLRFADFTSKCSPLTTVFWINGTGAPRFRPRRRSFMKSARRAISSGKKSWRTRAFATRMIISP